MPRLGKMLASVETTIAQMPEGEYIAELSFEDSKSKKGSQMIIVIGKIQGGDFDGRELKEYYVYLGVDGSINEPGLRGLKRLLVPLLGEDVVNAEDFDPIDYNGTTASVYVKEDTFDDEITKEPVPSNRLARLLGPA